jgi:hypothetical protein
MQRVNTVQPPKLAKSEHDLVTIGCYVQAAEIFRRVHQALDEVSVKCVDYDNASWDATDAADAKGEVEQRCW